MLEQWYEFSIGALFRLRDQIAAAYQAFVLGGHNHTRVDATVFPDASLLKMQFRDGNGGGNAAAGDDEGSAVVFRGLLGVMALLLGVSAMR